MIEPNTHRHAVIQCMILAITAPSDEQASDAVRLLKSMIEQFALTTGDMAHCQRAASAFLELDANTECVQ